MMIADIRKEGPIAGPSAVQDVFIDFETYSHLDVRNVGAWKYSEHGTTEALCLAYRLDSGPWRVWSPYFDTLPPDALEALHSRGIETVSGDRPEDLIAAVVAGAKVHAHNATFEFAIWHNVLKWPGLAISQLHCTMALMATFAFPLSLDKGGPAIGATVLKDQEGKRLLRKFSGTRKPSKNNPRIRIRPKDDPADFIALCLYCVRDVQAECALLDRLPRREMSSAEREVFQLDVLMNWRGVRIDVPTVKHIIRLRDDYAQELETKARRITGGIATSQRAAILNWCEDRGYYLKGYTKDDVAEAIADPHCPADVKKVLTIRAELGKASVSKLDKMLEVVGAGNKARGMVQYYGAQRTGRYAGRLVQVQNLPRGAYGFGHLIAPFLRFLTLEDIELAFDDPMELFSSLIRSMILADAGHRLLVSDFSNIEGRVNAWMAGQKDLIRQFASGDDVYKHMAATIFGVTYDEVTKDQRFVGKQAVLGCGYGMGAQKFLDTCLGYGRDIGFELAQKTVTTFRRKNRKIVQGWYDVETAAREAIRAPGLTLEAFKCVFRVQGDYLFIKLPSGRVLSYFKPRLTDGRITYMGEDSFTRKWKRVETYGGKLVENIVQAVSRDLMVHAMLKIEAAGYAMLTTVHDELVATAPIGFGSIGEFEALMSDAPDWADGCPIAVEGWEGERYRK